MEIEKDRDGRVVAVMSVADTVDAVSDRVGLDNALRLGTGLIDSVCIEAGERGRPCPESILIEFGALSTFRWV